MRDDQTYAGRGDLLVDGSAVGTVAYRFSTWRDRVQTSSHDGFGEIAGVGRLRGEISGDGVIVAMQALRPKLSLILEDGNQLIGFVLGSPAGSNGYEIRGGAIMPPRR